MERGNWFEVFNTLGTDIPPFGLMEAAGGFTDTGAVKVRAPSADNATNLIVNGPFTTPAGQTGMGSFNMTETIAFSAPDGAPADGDTIGSVSGSHYAKKGNTGFSVVGGSGPLAALAHRSGVAGVSGTGTDRHVVIWSGTTAIQDSLVSIASDGSITTPGDIRSTASNIYCGPGNLISGGAMARMYGASGGSNLTLATAGGSFTINFGFGITGVWVTGASPFILGTPGGANSGYKYSIVNTLGTQLDGVTRAIAPGDSFYGGINVGGGGGSFLTNGPNTFTGTQTIASGTAPALDAQQTAANTSNTIQSRNTAGTVTFSVNGTGDVTGNSFTGNGAGLTGLDAGNIASGVIPAARIGTVEGGTW